MWVRYDTDDQRDSDFDLYANGDESLAGDADKKTTIRVNADNRVEAIVYDDQSLSHVVEINRPTIFDTEWHHITSVIDFADSQTFRLYLDGELAGTTALINSESQGPAAPLALGNASGTLVGALDDVRVYGRALSDGDVAALFMTGGDPNGFQMASTMQVSLVVPSKEDIRPAFIDLSTGNTAPLGASVVPEPGRRIQPRDSVSGDASGDGLVALADLLILRQNFGKATDAIFADGDFDGDGDVDFADFLILAAAFDREAVEN